MIANALPREKVREREMAAGKVLVVSGLDVEETKLINLYVNIKEGGMGKGDGPGKCENV